MPLPVINNPYYSGQPVIVGGVEVTTTKSEQESGVDAPTKSIERSAEITQRNVLVPESGTITGAVDSSGLSSLRGLATRREPITITTPEATIQNCVVETVSRTRDGQFLTKFDVTIDWRQVFIAEIGSTTLQAVTGDGKKTKGSSGSSPLSLAGSDSKSSSQGANSDSSIGGYLDGLAQDVAGLFS